MAPNYISLSQVCEYERNYQFGELSDALRGCEGDEAAGGAVKRGAAAAVTTKATAAAVKPQPQKKKRPAVLADDMGHTSSNLSLLSKKSTGSIEPGSKLVGNTRLVPLKRNIPKIGYLLERDGSESLVASIS